MNLHFTLLKRSAVAALLLASLGLQAQTPPCFVKADYAVGLGPFSVAIADVNGDGRPDIVAANFRSDNVSVLLGQGDGSFGPKTDYAVGRGPQSVAIGNVAGDGLPDIVTANYFSDNVSVLVGQGGGSFGPKTDYPGPVSRST